MKKIFFLLLLLINLSTLLFSENALLKTDSGNIYGTIKLPLKKPQYPIVIIVAGSGVIDRDGNIPCLLFTDSYKMLANALGKNKIASLRYDKRGVGRSVFAVNKEDDLRFYDYVNDLVLWVRQVKADKRFNRIYVFGHSEGSLIGMVALQNESCDGFISFGGMGRRLSDIMLEQVKKNKNNPEYIIDRAKSIINKLLNGKTDNNIPDYFMVFFRPSVQPYLLSCFKYDPAEEIKKLNIPVLLLHGTEDIQVPLTDAEILSASNGKAVLKKLSGVTHTMKEIKNSSEQTGSYTNPDMPLSKEMVREIINFIK